MRTLVRKASPSVVAMVLVGLVAVGALGSTGSAAGKRGETLVFDLGKQELKVVDLGRSGPGAGDQWHIKAALERHGEPAASVRVVCHQASQNHLFCVNEITIGGRGKVLTEGYEDLRVPRVVDAVTGGTGQFRRVRGQATLDFVAGTLTLELYGTRGDDR
jgi:hypothetical protein